MKQATIPKINRSFFPIGLGTNAIGGHNIYQNIDENVSREIVASFIENKGQLIDTAYFYGLGRSEELIGETIAKLNCRDQVMIATKASFIVNNDTVTHDNSIDFLKTSIQQALTRLQTDYIDIFFIHFPDDKTNKREAIAFLNEYKKQGIIKGIGVSNFSLDQLKQANADGFVDVVQDRYHLLNRSIEGAYSDYLKANQIGFIPYSPLASGLLSGKYSIDSPLTQRQQKNPLFAKEHFQSNLEKIEILKKVAQNHQATPSQIALAWLLTRDFVSTIIPGAKQVAQVLSNLQTNQLTLSLTEIQLIDETFKP